MTRWTHVAAAAMLTFGLAGCADEPVERDVATTPTTAVDYGIYDENINTFLGDYVRDDEMFGDDDLTYEVRQGVVTVMGEVDNQQELTALQNRIRRVPAVRDVNVTGVRVAQGGV